MSSTLVSILPCKFQPAIHCFTHVLGVSEHKAKQRILRNQKLQSLGITGLRVQISDKFRHTVVRSGVGAGPSVPSNPNPEPDSWKHWILGILISIILSFWRGKWGPLLELKGMGSISYNQILNYKWGPSFKLKDKVETVINEAEAVADIVEKVADQVEEVVDDIGNHLPEGKLKDTLEIVEDMAEDTADGARLAGEFIDKVEEMVDDVESLMEHKGTDEQAKTNTKAEEEEEAKG